MRIAIPVTGGSLSPHFGHCEAFALIDVDPAAKTVLSQETAVAPPHEPGVLPSWLADKGVNLVLAGGMGSRAQEAFVARGVEVIVGAPSLDTATLIRSYLAGEIGPGQNACDH